VFVERLWRSVKYEEVYLRAYGSVGDARASLGRYLNFYNSRRRTHRLTQRPPITSTLTNRFSQRHATGRRSTQQSRGAVQMNRATSKVGLLWAARDAIYHPVR